MSIVPLLSRPAASLLTDARCLVVACAVGLVLTAPGVAPVQAQIPQQVIVRSTANGATAVDSADVDGDGDLDLISASKDDDKIAWYKNTSGVLPVELADFEARLGGDAVQLTWYTASETNNAGFRVQRTTKAGRGSAWTTVGSVEESETTAQARTYQFTDQDLPYAADSLTYRLKQVDTDGTAHYSQTVTVRRDAASLQLLAPVPNPATEQVTVRYSVPEGQDGTIRLYDLLGRTVRTVAVGWTPGRHEEVLDVSSLAAGVYVLRFSADGQTRSRKVVVQ